MKKLSKKLVLWITHRRLFWAVPFLVSLALSAVFFTTLGHYLFPDTVNDLCHTSWYADRDRPLVRTPAFPMFLEMWATIIPKAEWRLPALSLFQHGLILVDILLIQLLFRDRNQPVLAWVASFCMAVEGRNHLLAHTTQTEPLFITATLLFLWATLRWFDRRTWTYALLGGAALGLLLPLRTVGIVAFPVVACAFLLMKKERSWGQLTGYAFACFLVISAFAWRNEIVFNRYILNEEKGLHLLHGVVYHFDELPDTPTCREVTKIAKSKDYNLYGRDTLWQFKEIVKAKKGWTHQEVDEFLGKAAKEAILDRPLDYFWGTIEAIYHGTEAVDPVFNISVGVNEEYFEHHGKWYEGKFGEEANGFIAKFPVQDKKPRLGKLGYKAVQEFSRNHTSNFWRGWWVFPAMVVLGFMALRTRDPGFILCAGLSLALIWAASAGEAPQRRFYQVSAPIFMLSFWMGASYLRRWLGPKLEEMASES